jgi:preprotein translocase subunit SecE
VRAARGSSAGPARLHAEYLMAVESLARVRDFTTEMVDEIKKVTWPDWAQLKNATLVIIVFVLIVALVIWLMDQSTRLVLQFIMNLFTR